MKLITGYKIKCDWNKLFNIFVFISVILYIILCIYCDLYIKYDVLLIQVINMQISILGFVIFLLFDENSAVIAASVILAFLIMFIINTFALVSYIVEFQNLNTYLIDNNLYIIFYIFFPISLCFPFILLLVFIYYIISSLIYTINYVNVYIKQTIIFETI
jgi:hypothetical protein